MLGNSHSLSYPPLSADHTERVLDDRLVTWCLSENALTKEGTTTTRNTRTRLDETKDNTRLLLRLRDSSPRFSRAPLTPTLPAHTFTHGRGARATVAVLVKNFRVLGGMQGVTVVRPACPPPRGATLKY